MLEERNRARAELKELRRVQEEREKDRGEHTRKLEERCGELKAERDEARKEADRAQAERDRMREELEKVLEERIHEHARELGELQAERDRQVRELEELTRQPQPPVELTDVTGVATQTGIEPVGNSSESGLSSSLLSLSLTKEKGEKEKEKEKGEGEGTGTKAGTGTDKDKEKGEEEQDQDKEKDEDAQVLIGVLGRLSTGEKSLSRYEALVVVANGHASRLEGVTVSSGLRNRVEIQTLSLVDARKELRLRPRTLLTPPDPKVSYSTFTVPTNSKQCPGNLSFSSSSSSFTGEVGDGVGVRWAKDDEENELLADYLAENPVAVKLYTNPSESEFRQNLLVTLVTRKKTKEAQEKLKRDKEELNEERAETEELKRSIEKLKEENAKVEAEGEELERRIEKLRGEEEQGKEKGEGGGGVDSQDQH
ncbi:hypothetical protein AGMMS49936_11140 [Endomicrobiia bacterium]|nr:hypothetical protein AGMMS49936_11140 [Endomicrobiia bacterium]